MDLHTIYNSAPSEAEIEARVIALVDRDLHMLNKSQEQFVLQQQTALKSIAGRMSEKIRLMYSDISPRENQTVGPARTA